MRTNLLMTNRWRQTRNGLAGAALLLLGQYAASGDSFKSPLGTWDCMMTGTRQGVAYMTFQDDFTISMDEIIVPWEQHTSNPRGGPDPATRDGSSSGAELPPHVDLFGEMVFPIPDTQFTFQHAVTVYTTNFQTVDTTTIPYETIVNYHFGNPAGQWGYDTSGRLVGYFTEISAASSYETNPVPVATNVFGPFVNTYYVTNGTGTNVTFYLTNTSFLVTNVVYMTNVEAVRITNAVSFNGKVVPGKRLTLSCWSPSGRAVYRGVVPATLNNIEGQWYGSKIHDTIVHNEFFNVGAGDEMFNSYEVEGSGAGYTYSGTMLVSRQNRFAVAAAVFFSDRDDDNFFLVRAVTGPVNTKSRSLNGPGIQGDGVDDIQFKFKGKHMPTP